jgi:hypothetical protein
MGEIQMGNKTLIGLVVVVVAVLSLPLLTSSSKPETPNEVVTAFMEASESGVAEDVRPYVTAKAWEQFGSEFTSEPSETEYIVYEGTINGTEATVPTQITKEGTPISATALLRQESGLWLIYGMNMSAQGMEFTINFEDPEKMYEEIMEQAMAMMPPELRDNMSPELKKQMMDAMKKEAEKYK